METGSANNGRRIEELAALLSGGDRRSIGRVDEAVEAVMTAPELFDALIRLIEHPDPVVRMRAADAAEKITATRPDLLAGHETRLLWPIADIDQQEVRWHLAQIFPRLDLDAGMRKRAIELLFGYLDDRSRIVQTFSMQALADLAEGDPELRERVVPVIESLARDGGPAVRSRGRALLRQFGDVCG